MTQPPQIAGKGGRPKRQFTDEIVQRMEEMALNGCQNTTIAIALDVPKSTLVRRFGPKLRKKRCERKDLLRTNQTKLAKTFPAMAIFLGKNELGQVDKQVLATEPQQRELSEAQKDEAQHIASIRLHQESA